MELRYVLTSSEGEKKFKLSNRSHLDMISTVYEELDVCNRKFSMLEELRVSSNSLMEDTITEAELTKLTKLKALDLSYNALTFDISPDWIPPFQLTEINLSGCNPMWLRTQNNFTVLVLSECGISDEVPNWFWSLSLEADYIILSDNQLSGTISSFSSLGFIDVSSNKFSGPIPSLSPTNRFLNISQNMFTGSLLFNCSLIFSSLSVLDLSNNRLSGNLPNCWEKMAGLMFLDLANNNFSGEIPHALGYLSRLENLNLPNNIFSGELPLNLKNCKRLKMINIGDNMLNGSIPTWIGEYHEDMVYLILRNNMQHATLYLVAGFLFLRIQFF